MKIAIGCDHAGYLYKEEMKKFLLENNLEYIDCGTNSTESCDYPIFAKKVAKKVANREADYGVLICSSGEGVMITANKVKGIRAGLGYNDEVSKLMKAHNNANIIAFGSSFTSLDDVKKRTMIFLNAEFEGGRHDRRVKEIE